MACPLDLQNFLLRTVRFQYSYVHFSFHGEACLVVASMELDLGVQIMPINLVARTASFLSFTDQYYLEIDDSNKCRFLIHS